MSLIEAAVKLIEDAQAELSSCVGASGYVADLVFGRRAPTSQVYDYVPVTRAGDDNPRWKCPIKPAVKLMASAVSKFLKISIIGQTNITLVVAIYDHQVAPSEVPPLMNEICHRCSPQLGAHNLADIGARVHF